MVSSLIFHLGMWWRNPSLQRYYNFFKKSDHWSKTQLEVYQLEKLKQLLEFAYEHSVFYKEEFDRINFNPSSLKSLEDLKQIPIIDKSVLLKENKRIQSNYKFKKLFKAETSGTSGQVLKFFRNEEWDSANRAAIFRGYSWYKVKPWEKNGYFWGYNIDKKAARIIRFLDLLQNRFRIFTYDKKEIEKFSKKLKKAKYLSGYSSMIYEVAKVINRLGINKDFSLKMVKGTSEKIYEIYEAEVNKAFGVKMISEYGAAEAGLIAYECPEGHHMHICMENVVVEEEEGEIIVTNLVSYSFPIIRYKLGDIITLADKDFRCSCGREHPLILDVVGRIGKRVLGKKFIYPSLTFYYIFKNLALNDGIDLNYQVIQEEKGKVLLRVEQDKPELSSSLLKEVRKYFNNDLDVEILWGQELLRYGGKMRDFISMLE